VQNVLALFQEALEIGQEFIDIDLRGLGHLAGGHAGVELIKRYALTEVIGIAGISQHIMETNIMNIAAFKVFFGEIGSRATANYVFGHEITSFIFGQRPQM